jgi:hypothetical protein
VAPAVLVGEEDKLRADRALSLLGVECLPLVFSTNGRLSVRTQVFMKELARRRARMYGDGVSVALACSWLLQRVSVILQRANGVILKKVADIMRRQ